MNIDPKKAYAVRIGHTTVEILREFNTMEQAQKLWRDPRYVSQRDFATVTGAFILQLLESKKRKLVENTK